MRGLGPATRWERQRMRVRQIQYESTSEEVDYGVSLIGEIVAASVAERGSCVTRNAGEVDMMPRPSFLRPLPPSKALAAERDLYLRIFSGNSKASRRKAFRDWRHLVRDGTRAGATPHQAFSDH